MVQRESSRKSTHYPLLHQHPGVPKIADNLAAVQERIAAACDCAGRAPEDVQLIAVGKKFPGRSSAKPPKPASRSSAKIACRKPKPISDCPGHLRWHFIGNLQTNKCRDAVALFDFLHAVDSLHLAAELNKRCEQAAKVMPVLLR